MFLFFFFKKKLNQFSTCLLPCPQSSAISQTEVGNSSPGNFSSFLYFTSLPPIPTPSRCNPLHLHPIVERRFSFSVGFGGGWQCLCWWSLTKLGTCRQVMAFIYLFFCEVFFRSRFGRGLWIIGDGWIQCLLNSVCCFIGSVKVGFWFVKFHDLWRIGDESIIVCQSFDFFLVGVILCSLWF